MKQTLQNLTLKIQVSGVNYDRCFYSTVVTKLFLSEPLCWPTILYYYMQVAGPQENNAPYRTASGKWTLTNVE